jgi:glutathione S-transferase
MLLSPYAQTVMVTCNELGINYELIVVDLIEDEQKLPEFIEKQPFAAVPVFVVNRYRLNFIGS